MYNSLQGKNFQYKVADLTKNVTYRIESEPNISKATCSVVVRSILSGLARIQKRWITGLNSIKTYSPSLTQKMYLLYDLLRIGSPNS